MKFIRSILLLALIVAWVTPVFGQVTVLVECDKTTDSPAVVHRGEIIDYEVSYTNPNAFSLTLTAAADFNPSGDLDDLDTGGILPEDIAPAGTITFPYQYQVPNDFPQGLLINNGEFDGAVTGTPTARANCDPSNILEVVVPCVEVVKNVKDPICADNATWEITVTNCSTPLEVSGTEPAISAFEVVDDFYPGDLTAQFDKILLPGESQTVEYTAPVPADSEGETVVNTVEVVYYDEFDNATAPKYPVDDSDNASCDNPFPPLVCVEKTVTPETSKGTGLEEDAVTFTIEVCNCGEIEIQPVSVTDDLMGDLTGEFTDTLAPDACEEFSYQYIISVVEGEADNLTNTVTVVYEDTTVFAQATDEDNATVELLHPGYTFEISCMETGPVDPGTQIMFSAILTNTGDTDLIVDTTLPDANTPDAVVDIDLPAGGLPVEIIITVIAGSEDEVLGATATATIAAPYDYLPNSIEKTARALCEVGCSENCATRTLGFWKTHCDYTKHVFEVHMGGEMRIGCEDDVLTTIEEVLGVLYASNAKNTNGKHRTPDCQAFAIASKQVVVALLNNALANGAPLPYTVEQIWTIMCTGTKQQILALSAALDIYNNSGDDYVIEEAAGHDINPTDPATPQACKADAELSAADCASLTAKQAKKLGLE